MSSHSEGAPPPAGREKAILERWIEANRALFDGRGEEEVLRHVLQGVEAIGFDRIRLYRLSEEEDEVVGKVEVGMEVPFVGVSWPVAADDKMQTLIKDPSPHIFKQDEGELSPREIMLGKEGVGEWASVPVLLQDKVIGSLSADNKRSGRPITEQDLALLALFASQVAAVIAGLENADKDKEKLKLLEKLTAVTQRIVAQLGADSLDEQLTRIAGHVAELLDAEACEVLLVKREGLLSLEASYGHRRGGFRKGKEFEIVSRPGGGLTGHIAHEGLLFRAHGDALLTHFAVRGVEADHTRSGRCHSLLAAPLYRTEGQTARLVGLLRADNKQGADGKPSPSLGFSEEDAWVLQIFAEAIVVALETAKRVNELQATGEYLLRLNESSPNGVLTVDGSGFVTDSNAQAQLVLDYEPEELKGMLVKQLYEDEREARRISRLLLDKSAKGRVSNYETFALNKAGERIPIRLTATWLYDGQEQRVGSIGYFEDLRPIKSTVKQLTGLLEATNIIAQAPNLADGLQQLARKMAEDLKASFCRIFLFEEGQPVLVAKAAHAILDDGDATNWKPGLGDPTPVSEWESLSNSLEKGQPFLLKISGKRSRPILLEWTRRLGLAREIQSLLVLPLHTKERTLGLLDLGQLKNWQEAPFNEEKKELAAAIADQIAVLIDRGRLYESTEHRMEQLVALNERLPHLRGDKEPPRLLQEVVRLTTELAHCRVGGLYINHPRLEELVLTVTYNLPERLIGRRLSHAKGAAGRVARTGELEVFHRFRNWPAAGEAVLDEFGLQTVIAIPLRQAGEVEAEAVLFVGDEGYVEPDAKILQRFVDQAAVALQTARLMSPEQRTESWSKIWRKISQYVLESEDLDKVLRVVLTAITAGYGLGFNRAVIFLLDDRGERLVGRMGVGQQNEQEAKQAWEYDHRQALYDFGHYLKRMERGDVPETPLDAVSRGLRLPVREAGDDTFSRVVRGRGKVLVPADRLGELPEAFREAFEPTSPTVVIPLITRDQVIGLLAADNKFTLSPITPELIDSLCDFANAAAVAIDKDVLRARLFDLNRASGGLVPSQDLEQVLHDIVRQTRLAANASWVSMILIDELAQVRKLVIEGIEKEFDKTTLIRPGPEGISMEVMRTGKPYVIENASAPKHRGRVNPSMFRDGSVAALCLPLLLPGKKVGVIWIHYDKPRDFPQFEVDALQLYVNHAAITYDSARRLEELEQMRRAAEALAGAAGPQEVLTRIVQGARQVLQTDSAVILSYDPVRQRFMLESSAAEGIPADVWEQFRQDVPRSSQTAHNVMKLGWFGVEDLEREQHPDFLGEKTLALLRRIGARGFQATALAAGEEKLGVLYMIYKRPRRLNKEERRTAETFANHVALALRQTRLSAERDKRLREQEALVMLSEELLRRPGLQEAMDAAVKVAKEALGGDAANIVLEEQTGELVFAAQLGWEGVEVSKTRVAAGGEDSMTGYTLREKKPVRVDDYNSEERFPVLPLVVANRLVSGMSVPMLSGDEVVGTMAVHTRTPHRFSDAEENLLSLVANQTAVAIKSARQEKQSTRLRALLAASKAISRSGGSSGFDRQLILKRIVEEAVGCIADSRGRKSYLGIIQLYDPSTNELFFESALLPDELNNVLERIGDPRVLDRSLGRIGITGRVALIRQPQLVADVNADPDYLMISERIRSEIAVPLLSGDKVAGVIDLESVWPGAFDKDDLETLQALAELAVITIQNAEYFEARVEAGWHTALAWLGMTRSSLHHIVNTKAQIIREQSGFLREDLDGELKPEGRARVRNRVDMIERLAGEIVEEPILPPPSLAEVTSPIPVNQVVRDRVTRLWQGEPYSTVGLKPFDLALPDGAKVRANLEWLHRILDVLVDNAVEAVAGCKRREISITTRPARGKAEILVSDSGRGIPKEVLDKLLKEPIKRSSPANTRGFGLLIAQKIVRSYKGDLRVGATSPEGTTMIIALPLDA